MGTVLGDAYQVTRLLGQGGMGAVYEGVQTRLKKRVAIKVMDRNLAANTEAVARFRREIDVTAKLAHPNIVQISDFGTVPTGEPYLVMEFLEGEDLERRLARVGRVSFASAVAIVNQLASALAVTHAEGIVHRDLKPANVFLVKVPGQSDFVKVVDFGISKVLKASTTKLTRAQMIVGTPEYMSPEQAAGKVDEIDHRSDQWSLACIAWHMLVGQQPFVGPDVNSILHQVMNGEPPPLGPALAALLPGQVEAVLRKALSKRQIDRFPTITAFAKAFEAAAPLDTPMRPVTPPPAPRPSPLFPLASPRPAPSTASRPPRRWTWVMAALLATALGVGLALWQSGQLPWRGAGAAVTGDDGASVGASPAREPGKGERKKRRPAP
ncbi:MAG TPA: serine/threonine-protein kinase [Polyangia bacterium]|nr:serine/threonine-protein kinase [Polyangia bacterium]